MTALGYSQLSTDELVKRFTEGAKRTGTVYGLYGLDKNTMRQSILSLAARQTTENVELMQALGAELRRRKPIRRIRELFDDPDPDVRGWAGLQFASIDDDWASACTTGLSFGLTTREVLAWRRRVLDPLPSHPTLQEMSIAQLLERFVYVCERCYGATRFLTDEQGGGTDRAGYNEVSGEPAMVAKELHARGEITALVPMMDHPLVTVQEKAALCCLDCAPEKAAATLEGITGFDWRHEAVEGTILLDLWRMGKYKLPYG